mmetsp:Transcript_4583/g.10767  ORF Transcript_4583/g.10767 Transcript_4583/m.10767 type:complete len:213 (-) Transcript_4583:1410-2048(-)
MGSTTEVSGRKTSPDSSYLELACVSTVSSSFTTSPSQRRLLLKPPAVKLAYRKPVSSKHARPWRSTMLASMDADVSAPRRDPASRSSKGRLDTCILYSAPALYTSAARVRPLRPLSASLLSRASSHSRNEQRAWAAATCCGSRFRPSTRPGTATSSSSSSIPLADRPPSRPPLSPTAACCCGCGGPVLPRPPASVAPLPGRDAVTKGGLLKA